MCQLPRRSHQMD
ncbi:hypothetical protein POUND7_017428 [Theobroma cacao]